MVGAERFVLKTKCTAKKLHCELAPALHDLALSNLQQCFCAKCFSDVWQTLRRGRVITHDDWMPAWRAF
jgi:hypothetical protein